jgi:hypothetical protein
MDTFTPCIFLAYFGTCFFLAFRHNLVTFCHNDLLKLVWTSWELCNWKACSPGLLWDILCSAPSGWPRLPRDMRVPLSDMRVPLSDMRVPLRPSDSYFGQYWKPRTGQIPVLVSNDPKRSFRCMNRRQSTCHSAFDKPVELHWSTCGDKVTGLGTRDPLILERTTILEAIVSVVGLLNLTLLYFRFHGHVLRLC